MNQRHLKLGSSIAILFLVLAYVIGRVDIGNSQVGDSRKASENEVQSEHVQDTVEAEMAESEPVGSPALVKHSEPQNVTIDAQVQQLMASGSRVSLATVCGYDKFSISDRIESGIGIQQATDRFNLSDSRLQALSELEDRCQQFLTVLDDDPSLVPAIQQQQASLERYFRLSGEAIGTTGWNETLRSEAMDLLSSGAPPLVAQAALDLILYDKDIQKAIAEHLGTTDIGYISRMGPEVAVLLECRMQGNCGRSSFSALRYCVSGMEAFCEGVEQGISKTRSVGQYGDSMVMADFLMDLLNN
ncbi:MAG: hypothetical protein RQ826_05060 [Xanthomonadales bacterium]|nr:hypothetical protein [Xanthomonadales bacterium]